MKRIATALALGSLIVATQAVAADWFTTIDPYGDPVPLAARSTYADAHAGEPGTMTGSAFPLPGDGELIPLPAQSTYADVHAGEGNSQVGSAIPGADWSTAIDPYGDPVHLPALATYADRFGTDRVQQAGSTSEQAGAGEE